MDRSRSPAHRFRVTAATQDRLLAVLLVALAATGLVSLRDGRFERRLAVRVPRLLAAALAVTVAREDRSVASEGRRCTPLAPRRARLGAVTRDSRFRHRRVCLGRVGPPPHDRCVDRPDASCLGRHGADPDRGRPSRATPVEAAGAASSAGVDSARGPIITRRRLLAAGVLGAASVTLFGFAEAADRLTGGVRRFTGSRWLPAGGVPPTTTFLGEGAPDLDALAWRLHVHGQGADITFVTPRADGARHGRSDGRSRLHVGLGARDDVARASR